MSAGMPILRDIQTAVACSAVADPGALVRHVADLFIARSGDYSDEDLALFDDVLNQLVAEIETSARAFLALRLAPIRRAPPKIIRTLAFDPDTDVAGPILTQSERLDDPTLAENAGSMSQDHLLAISRRKSLRPVVTDVLVERGEAQVLLSAAQNAGAAFSDHGFARLVARAQHDEALAMCVGARADIPWHHFANLMATASAYIRAKLEQEFPHARRDVEAAVAEAAARVAKLHGAALEVCDPAEAQSGSFGELLLGQPRHSPQALQHDPKPARVPRVGLHGGRSGQRTC